MLKNEIVIREANKGDIDALTLLMNELGYPTTVNEMQRRLSKISDHPDYKTLIATINGEVVGMAGLAKGIFYEKNGNYMRIAALVVKQSSRNMGVGKALLTTAESLAVEQGLETILINCGNREERRRAHQFYHEMGYVIKSSGFVKQI
jgi:N-acetylglutamate synthase-like GNAT family acetyltransferase